MRCQLSFRFTTTKRIRHNSSTISKTVYLKKNYDIIICTLQPKFIFIF